MSFPSKDRLLEVRGLRKHFPQTRGLLRRVVGTVRALDGISFDIAPGETLGLVGESGSGKSTAGRAMLRLIEPTGGEILYRGESLLRAPAARLRELRRELQMVLQDSSGALNPRWSVGAIVEEGLRASGVPGIERRKLAAEALERVGLKPSEHLRRYPHELSGGQRQRVNIARALVMRPSLLVCDEAVSSLDVSVRAQVLNLLLKFQREEGTAYIFISHDLDVVRHVSDRIAVLYLGRIAELGTAQDLCQSPRHPYTRALLASSPALHPRLRARRTALQGEPPSPAHPPRGCRFHPRCPIAVPRCRLEEPPPVVVGPGHVTWCHLEASSPVPPPALQAGGGEGPTSPPDGGIAGEGAL